MPRRSARLLSLLLLGVLGAACTSPTSAPDEDVVGLVVAEPGSPRWTGREEPALSGALDATCPECRLETGAAVGGVEQQEAAVRAAVRRGADVLVVGVGGPVDEAGGEVLVRAAGRVPVVGYDAALPGAEHAVLLDHRQAGTRAGRALAGLLDPGPVRLLVLDGPDGAEEAVGATLDALGGRARVVDRLSGDGGPPGAWLAGRLADVDAVVAGGDETTAAVADAVARRPAARRPLVIGFGGGLSAVRRLVSGRQAVLVHEPRERQAEAAATVAAALATGAADPSPGPAATGPGMAATVVDGVPATVLASTVVTASTLTGTLVRRGVYTPEQICAGPARRGCQALGIR